MPLFFLVVTGGPLQGLNLLLQPMSGLPGSRPQVGLFRHHVDVQSFGAADNLNCYVLAGTFAGQQFVQIVDTAYGLIVEPDDQVAFAQARFLRGTVRLERHDQDGALNRQIVITNDAAWQRNVLARNPDQAARDASVANQSSGYEFRRVDGGRKADALRRPNYGCIDTD